MDPTLPEILSQARAVSLLSDAAQALKMGQPSVCLSVLKVLSAQDKESNILNEQERQQAVTLAAAALELMLQQHEPAGD